MDFGYLLGIGLGTAVFGFILYKFLFKGKGSGGVPVIEPPKINDNNNNNNNNDEDDEEVEENPIFFTDKSVKKIPLIEKIEISHDTRLFRFGLPTKNTVLGLPVGKHFKIYAPNPEPSEEGKWNGREDNEAGKEKIERKYTPTSSDDDLGVLDLVIKVYNGGVIEQFPDGGKMSQYLDQLKIGDEIDIKGPFGLLHYQGNGNFSISRKPKVKSKVGMICGGTGVTPMYQILKAILKDPEDKTEVSLLFANKTEEDILLREELENLQKKHPNQFKLHYTLDNPSDDWKHYSGFVNKEMIQETMPAPGDDSIILMCGPPPMIKYALKPNLEEYNDTFAF